MFKEIPLEYLLVLKNALLSSQFDCDTDTQRRGYLLDLIVPEFVKRQEHANVFIPSCYCNFCRKSHKWESK